MISPLVSVTLVTYNSAATIIEALESVKAQTYSNIELIISDDCSTDNTVALYRDWIERNKNRFVRTKLMTAEKNMGISVNCNRAAAACRGEWVKPIAGDDLLMPTCVEDYMDYVAEHPDTIYLFGKQKAFGASEERCKEIDAVFDYTFFNLTQEQQLHRLIFDGNCVPATTLFYNRVADQKVGIKNDERIPLLEDWPKWINLIRAGVKLHFVDKVLVMYRVNGMSTGLRASLNAYRSNRLFDFYYRFHEWQKENEDKAIQRMVDHECNIYQMLIESETDMQTALHYERNQYKQQYETYYKLYNQICSSKAYRIGKILLKPIRKLKQFKS